MAIQWDTDKHVSHVVGVSDQDRPFENSGAWFGKKPNFTKVGVRGKFSFFPIEDSEFEIFEADPSILPFWHALEIGLGLGLNQNLACQNGKIEGY